MSRWKSKYGVFLGALMLLMNVSEWGRAQITVSPSQTAAALAQKLAGQGIVVLNPVLNCPSVANGFFNSAGALPGFDSGIVLTTGRAQTSGGHYGVNGYSAYLASNNNSAGGDAMLNTLAGQQTMDACSLEFDLLPTGDTISVDYVFSSEEYISAVCGPYNDAFAFFISGPGISGQDNMALVPGTQIPVTINTINNGVPGSTGNIVNCTDMGAGSPFTAYYLDNSNGNALTHKGLTTVLQAVHAVTRCGLYHLKIVIADAGNALYDSGVFLKAGSLQTQHYNIEALANPVYDTTAAVCVKGCLPGHFAIKRSTAVSYPQTVKFVAQGTAVAGYDYAPVADSVVIPANALSADVTINGLLTPANGVKTLQLLILSPVCDGSTIVIDSAEMLIYDTLHLAVMPADTVLCSGDSLRMRVKGDNIYTYNWAPVTNITDPYAKQPVVAPLVNTIYTVTAVLPGSACPPQSASIAINIRLSPMVALISDTVVCYHASFNLSPLVAPANSNYSYNWSGPGSFASTLVDPQFSGVTSANGGVYTFIVRNDTNNCTAKSTVNVVVNTPDSPAVTSPVIYCLNNKAESLTASGKDLLWYAPAASAPASIAPVVPTQTIADYIYYVTQMSGNCESPRSEIAVSVIRCCDGDLFIPSAFSPNNDGLNDYFQPHPAFGYFIKAVSVYNRWGQLVYSGTEGKWNGKFGLTDADAGTYYYSIIFGCILGGTTERHGDVTLVR